ncbi:MAG TPA: hypothetical protein DCL66_03395 [Gammaproteobacteria bacterium]|nr:hypothetical protein [Gammaproteobacteria bacterium]
MSILGKLTLLVLSLSAYSSFAALPQFKEQSFSFPPTAEKLLVADFNDDELNDLLVVTDVSLRIYFQRDSGFDFENGFSEIDFAGRSVGWDLSNNYQGDGSLSLIAVVDGNQVLAWHVEAEEIKGPSTVTSDIDGYLSKGINRLHFSRDINGDGLEDLIIPGAGQLQIHMNEGNGGYQTPLAIQSDFRIRTNLDSSQLERRIGQAVRIPLMELRDVNSDGANDLISRTEELLDVFLANATGPAYFSATPSYSVNIAEIEARLGDFDIDNLDFSNLTGILALGHEELLEDVDGDGIDDLLLREGGKVSLFGGTINGMAMEQPRQVLRSSGNILSTFLFDENNDELKDLWLWRVEPISVGDIFVWLALSGSIAIEAFIYPNEGERFARRPARKITVSLKFPSVIRLANSVRGVRQVSATDAEEDVVSTTGNFNDEPARADLLALIDNQLALFFNSIEPQDDETEFLGALGYSRDQDSYEIDIREIVDNALEDINQRRSSIESLSPDLTIPLSLNTSVNDIITVKINGDDTDDIFVFEAGISGQIAGLLLLSGE